MYVPTPSLRKTKKAAEKLSQKLKLPNRTGPKCRRKLESEPRGRRSKWPGGSCELQGSCAQRLQRRSIEARARESRSRRQMRGRLGKA